MRGSDIRYFLSSTTLIYHQLDEETAVKARYMQPTKIWHKRALKAIVKANKRYLCICLYRLKHLMPSCHVCFYKFTKCNVQCTVLCTSYMIYFVPLQQISTHVFVYDSLPQQWM